MQVKVLKTWIGTRNKRVGEIINVPDCLAKEWIEGGYIAPVENKLMPPPSENKAQDASETGKEATEPSGVDKPVRRKIKHRKKAVTK
jgi:hypothetical protein